VGNLVAVMLLVHLQRAGHRVLALVGGGTGLIGDPSGKSKERDLNPPSVVAANSAAIRSQLERFLHFNGSTGAMMVDNADWLLRMGAVEFMRDVGKHFTINYMLAKESVKSRMEAGLSYTEFSYMLLQAYDFLELHRRHGVTFQVGGSDQWGNMTAGIELIRRVTGNEAHVITAPLITTSTGAKFGKSEAGAIYLDPARTSPYQFFQFWINADDRDVGRYLRFFTLKSREEIEALDAEVAEHPERREAQLALAMDVTARVHGEDQARVAREMSTLLFRGGDPSSLSPEALAGLRREIPFAEIVNNVGLGEAEAAAPDVAADIHSLLVVSGLAASRGEAKKLLRQGGVYVNGVRRTEEERFVLEKELLADRHVLLRKGARNYALVRLRGEH
jgi:tyrosyl-tRNA synthetase